MKRFLVTKNAPLIIMRKDEEIHGDRKVPSKSDEETPGDRNAPWRSDEEIPEEMIAPWRSVRTFQVSTYFAFWAFVVQMYHVVCILKRICKLLVSEVLVLQVKPANAHCYYYYYYYYYWKSQANFGVKIKNSQLSVLHSTFATDPKWRWTSPLHPPFLCFVQSY